MAKNEPQSYGSQGDWLTGKTGETVNRTEGPPTTQNGDFYESRHESGSRSAEQGGKLSPEQLAENADTVDTCEVVPDEQPVSKVTTTPGGARRGSAFKDRDYE